jgi:hypothetical protein
MTEDQQKIREVKRKYEEKWLSIKGIVGIGIGTLSDENIGIVISVIRLEKGIQEKIPDQIEGVKIEIRETGEFKAL